MHPYTEMTKSKTNLKPCPGIGFIRAEAMFLFFFTGPFNFPKGSGFRLQLSAQLLPWHSLLISTPRPDKSFHCSFMTFPETPEAPLSRRESLNLGFFGGKKYSINYGGGPAED